jgi:hypothetical protein
MEDGRYLNPIANATILQISPEWVIGNRSAKPVNTAGRIVICFVDFGIPRMSGSG